MSCEFSLFIARKDDLEDEKKCITLFWLSTTPARQLSSDVALRYEETTEIGIEKLREIQNWYIEKSNWLIGRNEKLVEKAEEYMKGSVQATTKEVSENFIELAEECRNSIEENVEEIEDLRVKADQMGWVIDVYHENVERYSKTCEEDAGNEDRYKMWYYLG